MLTVSSQSPDVVKHGATAQPGGLSRTRMPFPAPSAGPEHAVSSPGATQPMVEVKKAQAPTRVLQRKQPGQVYFGTYRLERLLGSGATSEVWLASQIERVEGWVALKFLVADQDEKAVESMRAEVQHARRMDHPGVVRIFGYHHHGPEQAIAMEYVDGRNLADLASEQPQGFFDPEALLGWLRSLGDAVDYAHQRHGIVHRDIKPANLLVDAQGRVRLVDFGISCRFDPHAKGTQYRGGTRPYMSPQQRRGQPVSPADDIFAIGVTLYELLTGTLPYGIRGIEIDTEARPPLRPSDIRHRHRRPPLPRGWDAAILACLDPDPARRPSTVRELVEWLDAGGEVRPSAEPRFQRVLPWVLVASGLALLLGALLITLWRLRPAEPRSESPPSPVVFRNDLYPETERPLNVRLSSSR